MALRIADGTITEVGRIDHLPAYDEEEPVVEPPCPTIDPGELGLDEIQIGLPLDRAVYMLCDEDTRPEMKGFWCQTLEQEAFFDIAEGLGVSPVVLQTLTDLVPEGQQLTTCLPEDFEYRWTPPIQRTLVIGENLWSYSYGRLQANALDGLDRTDAVNL